MESIGDKLRLAREKNNYTIEQISRDTHVAKRFLKALEDEDFSVFPGETYAMGFLRNYAEYLGLNAEELVGLYRSLKIQEQPLPMIELLESRPKINTRLLVIIAAAIVVAGVGGLLILRSVVQRGSGPKSSQNLSPLGKGSEEFIFQEEVRTKWFKQGDAVVVPLNERNLRLEISTIDNTLTLRVPGGTVELSIGQQRLIDLDSDSKADLKVVWNDVDRTSTPKRANLGLYRVTGVVAESGAQASSGDAQAPSGTQPQAGSLPTAAAQPAVGAQSTAGAQPTAGVRPPSGTQPTPGTQPQAGTLPAPSTQKPPAGQAATAAQPAVIPVTPTAAPARGSAFKALPVIRANSAEPFTVDMVFRDYCLFRFLVDDKEREERFFQKGESFTLDAKSRITLWLSNSGSVKARISGKDVELGRLGEVATRQIAWRKDTASGEYVLEISPLY